MDIELSNKQIKQLALTISIDDVLGLIMKDYNGYLEFLDKELKNSEITEQEYKRELKLIEILKNKGKEVNL